MTNSSEVKRNLAVSVALILLIFTIGIAVYHSVEGWNVVDCIYFITVTITTIGYGDIVPKTWIGKIFTVVLIWVGISVAFFLIYSISAFRERSLDHHVLSRLSILKNLSLTRKGARKEYSEKVKDMMSGKQ